MRPSILVVGDVMADREIVGTVSRTCPESMDAWVLDAQDYSHCTPGGAGAVAMIAAKLGAKVSLVGAVGDDGPGMSVVAGLDRSRVDTRLCLVQGYQRSTIKTRLYARDADGNHKLLLRIDRDTTADNRHYVSRCATKLAGTRWDAILVADYGKGVVNADMMDLLRSLQSPIIVDPCPANRKVYGGVWGMTPNRRELCRLSGVEPCGDRLAERAVEIAMQRCDCEWVAAKLDRDGIVYSDRSGGLSRFPSPIKRRVVDVTHAGDTVLAVLGVTLQQQMSVDKAMEMAVVAGGMQVEHRGLRTFTLGEIRDDKDRIARLHDPARAGVD